MGSPYRDHHLEGLGQEDKGLMPVSPVYGPDCICPKCGAEKYVKKKQAHYPYDKTYASYVTEPRFCYEHKRVWIRLLPWPKRCGHPGEHMHQECKKCKAHWVSWPLCQKPEE